MSFSRIGEKEGLKTSTVYVITQDKEGFMWFGTKDGLHRFDTKNFRTFLPDSTRQNSLKNEKIRSLLIDSQNRFWVGTAQGVQLFDRLTEKFTDFQLGKPENSKQEILSIYEDREKNMWFGTEKGLYRWHEQKQTWSFYRSAIDTITHKSLGNNNYLSGHIFQDSRGKYWAATWIDGYGIVEIDVLQNKVSLPPNMGDYYYNSINPISVSSASLIDKMYEDSKGFLWFASFLGLYRYDPRNQQFTCFKGDAKKQGALSGRTRDVCEDSEGTFWVATYGGGLARFDPKTETFIAFKHNSKDQSSISSNYIRCLFRDRDGNIWIGTDNGISILDPLDNQFELLAPVLDNALGATIGTERIEEDQDGTLWSRAIQGKEFLGAANHGIWGYNPISQEKIEIPLPKIARMIARLSDSTFLIQAKSTSEEDKLEALYVWHSKTRKLTPYQSSMKLTPSMKNYYSIHYQKDELWLTIGAYNVFIYQLRPDFYNLYTYGKEFMTKGKTAYNFILIRDTEGFNWFSSFSNEVFYLDKSQTPQLDSFQLPYMINDSTIINQLIRIPLKKDTEQNQYTTALLDYQDELLVSTSDVGIFVIDKKTKKIKKQYTQKDGLLDNGIYAMIADKQGVIWLSQPKGITKWNKKTEHFEHYYAQTDIPTVGMKAQGNQRGTGYCSPFSGKIYFSTDEGLIAFDPKKLRQNRQKPDVFISKFKLFGKEYAFDSVINAKKEIVLNYDQNFISFELAALNYSNYSFNQYAYRMENFDQNWILLGTKNEAIYTNLPAGTYTFRFRASNDKGVWNEKENFISVIVLPPWWATWWFRTLALSLILGGAWTFYKIRIGGLKKQRQILEQTVQARTLEIEQQKATISMAFAQNKAVTDALDSSAIVSIGDLQGRIIKANDIFSQISGYSMDELMGQDHRIVNSGHHPKSFWVEMWKTIAKGQTWRAEVCNRTKNGEIYWVDTVINPIYDEKGKIYQYLSIRTLVTERKNAEKTIQIQNEELQNSLAQLILLRQKSEDSLEELNVTLDIVSKQRDDIISSINYALRIQNAIIPQEQELQKHFDCFVFFRPKDIVSGDFYWFADKGNKKIIAVADCTGHGVSGAFMTMIGNNILNQIVHDYEIHEPDEILNLMPILLEKTLSHSEGKVADGMDISIISIQTLQGLEDLVRFKVSYAGAMNPLYYVQNQEFKELKADKKPIGEKFDEDFTYKKHEIIFDEKNSTSKIKNSTFYLCSDGFQDQFGGAGNRKFMSKNLKKLFFELSDKPMAEQKQILEKTFDDWKGKSEQTDDVLVVGVRL